MKKKITFRERLNKMLNKWFEHNTWVSINYKKEIPSFIIESVTVDKKKVDRELRINVLILISFLVFSAVIYRALSLSVEVNNPFKNLFKNKIEIAKSVTKDENFSRIDIVDRRGVVLATDLPIEELYANPSMILFPERTAKEIKNIFPEINKDKLLKKFKSGKKFVYVKRKISPEEKQEVLKIGDPGLNFIKRNSRFYPQGNQFSKILGSTDIDNNGVSGIEKYFNEAILNSEENETIKLSVDTNINYIIRKHLLKAMERFSSKNAGAILMRKDTGEVISMVSLPDYHPKNAKKFVNNSLYNNHMTLSVYEAGSIFKVFNTAMALEEGLFSLGRTYDTRNPVKIKGATIKDKKHHGVINIPEVLSYSSNVGSARIALELGREVQEETLRRFHLFNRSPIEIPEVGLSLTPKPWNEVATAVLSYGYGMSVSPINLLSAFNSTINDGCYVNPTLIDLSDEAKKIVYRNCDRVISEENSEIIRKNLRLVVLNGTAQLAKSDKIKIGGKTGTSFKQGNGGYSDAKITFFTSAFPIEDPKYSMLIFFNDVKAEETRKWCNDASCNAVPVSKDIIEEIYEILD